MLSKYRPSNLLDYQSGEPQPIRNESHAFWKILIVLDSSRYLEQISRYKYVV